MANLRYWADAHICDWLLLCDTMENDIVGRQTMALSTAFWRAVSIAEPDNTYEFCGECLETATEESDGHAAVLRMMWNSTMHTP